MINFTHIIAGVSGKNSGYRFLTSSILGDIKRGFVFEQVVLHPAMGAVNLEPIRKVKTAEAQRFLNTSLCSLRLRGKLFQKPQRRRGTESFFKILLCISVAHSEIYY